MYVYKITNLINNKIYIGITIDYNRRWKEHCQKRKTIISKAIEKYGKDNFEFKVLESGHTPESASKREIELIHYYNSLVPNGYNVMPGGEYHSNGINNGNAKLTNEDVIYIKTHRDIPEYILYDNFCDKITYDTFKNVYLNKTYKDILPTVDPYPYNLEFSCQFTNSKLNYNDIVEIRQAYQNGDYWQDVYEKYKNIILNKWSFWSIYNGKRYYLVMPEVFNEENKRKHHLMIKQSHSGENNGRSKLTKEDVLKIRELKEKNKLTNNEIYKLYPQVSSVSIRNILNYKTWVNL